LVAWNSAVTVRVGDLVAPPVVLMMVDDCGLATGLVVTVKVAAVDPAGTVMLGGTVAAVGLLLDSETTTPPPGADAVSETVAVTGVPPTTVVWLRVSAASDGAVDGGGAPTVHPAKVAVAAVVEPSLTAAVQSAGAVNPARSTRNRPAPSLVPMATPSTVMVRLAAAVPSMRRFPALTSARETVTAPYPTPEPAPPAPAPRTHATFRPGTARPAILHRTQPNP
jgi:hypothetical protein